MNETKSQILEILSSIKPGVSDFESIKELVHGGTLDSLSIVMLIGELSDAFDIEIPPSEITYENFDTVDGLVAMVERLSD
ncbi:MAG: phosphopantetheine-binding protein [Bacilli bacterium]|nr:phosphopantetheine-binding protein [Bacilli bacterium]